jgi:hypothetical protein
MHFSLLSKSFIPKWVFKAKGYIRCIHPLAVRWALRFYNAKNSLHWSKYESFYMVNKTEGLFEVFQMNIDYCSFTEEKNSFKHENFVHNY